jgi:hypothetical protein
MLDATISFGQGLAAAFLSSRLGEGEVIFGLLVGLGLMAFFVHGRESADEHTAVHGRHHRRP